MAKIVDPDLIEQGTDIVYDTNNFTIALLTTGAISDQGSSANNGVTLQCIYSKAIEDWNDDAELSKFRFPFEPITSEQFELINGWNFADELTESLIRDAGWAVRNTSGNTISAYVNIASLGTFDAPEDRAYFQQEVDGPAEAFAFPGEINLPIQILDDPNGDGSFTDGFDRRAFLRVFLREENKAFGSYDLIDEQQPTDESGIIQMTYRKYSLPLSNGPDLNYIDSDSNIGSSAPYTDVLITYLDGQLGNEGNYEDGFTYQPNDVVSDLTGRWFITETGGTSDGFAIAADSGVTWIPFEGERQIGSEYFPYFVIIDANADDLATGAERQDVYEKIQYSLRQNTDINEGSRVVIGETADDLLRFEGDTLITLPGVYIDDFNAIDTNNITFTDATATARRFPFIAAGNLVFNDNLQNDAAAKYFLFFTNDDAGDDAGNDFNTSGATLIQDANTNDITGLVSSNSSITFDYDYDGNTQRGATSAGTDVPYTGVAIGQGTAQYVLTTGNLIRSTTNSVNFVSSLERVYLNP